MRHGGQMQYQLGDVLMMVVDPRITLTGKEEAR